MTAGLPVGQRRGPRGRYLQLLVAGVVVGTGALPAVAATDTTRPTISITDPSSDGTYTTTSANVALRGTAADNVGVTKVTWVNDRGGRGRADGTTAWSITGIKLATGANRIVVRAHDAAGNRRRAILTVNYATTASTTPNQPPVISGTPPTSVAVGVAYDFTPKASDPEGQPLTFSVMGAPAWTVFDSRTGRLSGTPASADAGITEGIVITVADGTGYASLAPFSLQVEPSGAVVVGSALVSWNPPTERTDGSPLADLTGYEINYGTDAGALDHTLRVSNPGLSNCLIEGLGAGTWYFNAVAYDSAGNRSAPSNTVSTTIQ